MSAVVVQKKTHKSTTQMLTQTYFFRGAAYELSRHYYYHTHPDRVQRLKEQLKSKCAVLVVFCVCSLESLVLQLTSIDVKPLCGTLKVMSWMLSFF